MVLLPCANVPPYQWSVQSMLQYLVSPVDTMCAKTTVFLKSRQLIDATNYITLVNMTKDPKVQRVNHFSKWDQCHFIAKVYEYQLLILCRDKEKEG